MQVREAVTAEKERTDADLEDLRGELAAHEERETRLEERANDLLEERN